MLIFTRGCSVLFLPGLKKQNQKNNVNPNKNKHEFQTEHSLKIYVVFWVLSKIFGAMHVHIKLAQVPRLCESELPHLFCIKFGGTCAWILEKLLTWMPLWHVGCAIYVVAIWGGSPVCFEIAPSVAVANMIKLHALGCEKSADSTCWTEH